MRPHPARRTVLGAPMLAAAVLAGCASRSRTVVYEGDWEAFDTERAMFDAADAVLAGVVDSFSVARFNVTTDPVTGGLADRDTPEGEANRAEQLYVYTVYELAVTDQFKGAPRSAALVKLLGGTINGSTYVARAVPDLSIGAAYLMYLADFEDSPSSVLHPQQAVYVLGGDEPRPITGTGLGLPEEITGSLRG